ncbi:zinc-binding dehydrogenase [Myxococcus sp. CA039A]|uniref:zinc-binding dehydrogenase n=1 Tax=Myxococcus sp. CA039A TaxID=2741737 RepID=UPI00157A6EF3|nr:zinc-binding dehydrogenase [Myxococcus sp. CA039A]NTX54229.1 zinc-binding dehydrogenase [Myxococcus sp. CA039A]
MKVVRLARNGGPEVLTYEEVPTPTPGEGQVRVRVKAIGLNFGDTVIRQGDAPVRLEFPFIPCMEAAGVVEALGPGVTGVGVGARVVVPLFVAGRLGGAAAEALVVETSLLVPLPDAISFEQGAAMMLQGLTALWMLAHVPPAGRAVLVHAAAGGVGSWLVQLARLKGARSVIATASTSEKLAVARRLGADVVVSYAEPDWPARVRMETEGRGPDVIYDQVGGEVRRLGLEVLAIQGTLVIYGGAATHQLGELDSAQVLGLYSRNQFVTGFSGWPLFGVPGLLARSYDELFTLVGSGQVEVLIGQRYPLADIAQAHRALRTRETTGKVLLIP